MAGRFCKAEELRQAQHERETLIVSMLFSLILRLSKDEQRVFQQTARF